MIKYEVKKHWLFWGSPVLFSCILLAFVWPLFLFPTTFLVAALIILIPFTWASLRWKLDIIQIKEDCLYSRIGVIFIDEKNIPLEQISFISQHKNIISSLLKCSDIQIQSSALGNNNIIQYRDIANAEEFISIINETKNIKGKQ